MTASENMEQQHQEQIDSTREALTDKFKDDMSSLEDNVLIGMAMFLSEWSVSDTIKDYLSSGGIGDMIQDKILGAALKKALAGNQEWESKGLELFDTIQKARNGLLALHRKKAKEWFSDELTTLRQEFGIQWVVPVRAEAASDEVADGSFEEIENTDISWKKQLLFADVVSSPFERGRTSTLCSATVQKNAINLFNLVVPSWNAIDAQNLAMDTATQDANNRSVSSQTKDAYIESVFDKDAFSQAPASANVADVFVKSNSKYWHRCLAFKKFPQNERYILDPYRAPDKKSTEPKKLSDYEKRNKIVKVNFYETDTAVVDTLQEGPTIA